MKKVGMWNGHEIFHPDTEENLAGLILVTGVYGYHYDCYKILAQDNRHFVLQELHKETLQPLRKEPFRWTSCIDEWPHNWALIHGQRPTLNLEDVL